MGREFATMIDGLPHKRSLVVGVSTQDRKARPSHKSYINVDAIDSVD
jgi:hypothetical protein